MNVQSLLVKVLALLFVLGISITEVRGKNPKADPLIAKAMKDVAKAVVDFMENEGRTLEIIVGDISGLPNLKASGGVEISRLLEIALENAGITIDDDADTQLMGRFRMIEKAQFQDHDFKSLAMKVQLTLLDENGQELAEPEITIFGNQILEIAGLNAHLPAKASQKTRQRELIRQFKVPDTGLKGNEIHNGGPFGIEVLINNSGNRTSVTPTVDKKGRPFVPLHLGEEYIVRIHNHADFEAGVTLVIDGVNVFVNSKDDGILANSRFVVQPGSHIDVPGWFITKHKSNAFEIGGFEESVAAQQGESRSSAKTGTITAVFRACWAADGKRPADEPGGTPKGGGLGTKLGRDIAKEYSEIAREFGTLRSTISVRYDR